MAYKGLHSWDEHSGDYHSSGHSSGAKGTDSIKYSEHQKYAGAEEDKSGKEMYRKADEEDKKKEKTISDRIEEESKGKEYKNKEESAEEIKKKAADEISKEMMAEKTNTKKDKKTLRTIEDAIKEAIEGEKKTVFLD